MIALARLDGVVLDLRLFLCHAQDVAALAAIAENRNAFAVCLPGRNINVLDIVWRSVVAQVDRGRNRIIYVFLHGCLQLYAVEVRYVMAFDDPWEAAFDFLILGIIPHMVIVEQILYGMGIDLEGLMVAFHFVRSALIADLVERFAAAGEYTHEQGNRTCRCDGEQRAIAQAAGLDLFIYGRCFLAQKPDERGFFRLFPIITAKGAFLFCELSRSAGCFGEHQAHDACGEFVGLFAAVFKLHRNERIRQGEEPEAYAAPVIDAVTVLVQRLRIVAVVQYFIESSDGCAYSFEESIFVEVRCIAEFVLDEIIEVDAHEVAGIIGIAAKFSAGVRDIDGVVIVAGEQGIVVQAVDEECTWIAPVPLRLAVFVEEIRCLDFAADFLPRCLDIEFQLVLAIVCDGLHEIILEQDGKVHGSKFFIVLLHM